MSIHDTWDILLVEDTAADAELIQLGLRQTHADCQIHHTTTGESALTALRSDALRNRIGLVLLDLNLPGISGAEVLQDLRTDPNLAGLPVVVLTTSDNEDEVRWLYQHRANAFIVKPLGLDGYCKVLEAVHTFWATVARLPSATHRATATAETMES